MLKLTKTGIGLLTRQYRSVLKKCWAINVGIFALSSMAAMIPTEAEADMTVGELDTGYTYAQGQTVTPWLYSMSNHNIILRNSSVVENLRYLDNAVGTWWWSSYNYINPENAVTTNLYYLDQAFANYYQKTDKISIGSDGDGGNINFYNSAGTRTAQLTNTYNTSGESKYAQLRFYSPSGSIYTYLDYKGFKLNNSTEMTGITHNEVVAANASSTVAKLVSESTLARSLNNYYQKTDKITIDSDNDGGTIIAKNTAGQTTFQLTHNSASGGNGGASIRFFTNNGADMPTVLSAGTFKLNGSDTMTGITHDKVVAADANSTVAKLVSESTLARSLNNYYTKEDLDGGQVIDFARYFKSGKFGENARFLGVINDNFATNLTSKIGGFATNHPPRLGAFAKCEKACSRLSERYIAALGKNRVFEYIASADAGTFLIVQETNKNVMDSFYKNRQCLKASNDNFAITTFLRVI